MTSKIIVALDGMPWHDVIALATQLRERVWGFKLNDALFSEQCDLTALLQLGNLMLDPKLYDIPTTVSNSVAKLAERTQPREIFLTMHASAGHAAINAVTRDHTSNIKIIAVTALTSFTDSELLTIYNRPRAELVRNLALVAYGARVHGLVCSTDDLKIVGDIPVMKIVPGIRLPGDQHHDQVQVGTGAGADLVVIGRPITQSFDPVTAVARINDFLST